MYISAINMCSEAGVARVEAHIAWEETEHPPFSLFAETDTQVQKALWADPNAFVVACILPAWRSGERRVKVDGSLCPVLFRNVRTALATLKAWYPAQLGPAPTIEPSRGFKVRRPFQGHAVSLLSCGIDSLATLRWNKLHLPSDHPASIKGVIVIDFNGHPELSAEESHEQPQGRLAVASEVAADADVDLIPVRTNLWWLVNDGYFFDEKWHGAVLSSIASFFSGRFHKAYIASTHDAAHLHPWGSHPLLDSYYSSAHFQIEHHGLDMSRFEKTALIADWPIALQNIRVCQNDSSGNTNCGTCEKCIRTMTALVALGKLKDCRSFPGDDVSPELLYSVQQYHMIPNEYEANWYRELLPALTQGGRHDLVTALQQFVLSYAHEQANRTISQP